GAYDQDPGVQGMLAWQGGDETAFDRLVEEYSPKVYSLLTRFLGPHPKREDMVQEVFLRVVRARERYEPTARFSTWIYRIVFNLAVNETQRGRKHQSLDGDDDPDSGRARGLEPIDEREALPSESLEREDVVSIVRAAIAALPENQRMALVLAKYHDMPYTEIAEGMESTEKAIKSMVHRGRERLRESLSHLMTEEML
ncbi:MAG: sigma-70 family RNA polymerase sigma factor, partial [Planctomycetota bacterium]